MRGSPDLRPGRRPRPDLSAPRLIGRAAELATLAGTLAGAPAVAVVEGETGIGKTRLVTELRTHPELADRPIVVGACRQVRDPFPLGPVIEAVRRLGPTLAGVSLSPVAGALRPLLPELTGSLPAAPEPLADRRAGQHRVYRALVEVLAGLGPAVVVLEDLHWADQHTIDFLHYLLGDPPPQLSLALTFRGEEVDPQVRALTAKLPAALRLTRLVLAPLDTSQTGALAAAILGADRVPVEFASYLCRRASGLPFAIEELLALLRERGDVTGRAGGWCPTALAELEVPTAVRDQVLERTHRLPEAARSVLATAAVLQEPVPVAVLLAACELPDDRAVPALEQALAAGFLVEQGNLVGFRHLLAAQAIYGHQPRVRRERLHARAAAVLQAVDPAPLGQVAHHLRHAGRLVEWVVAAEQAADQAIDLGHDAEAARLLAEVLELAALEPDRRGRIAVKLAQAASSVAGSRAADRSVVDLLATVLEQDVPGPRRGELCLFTAVLLDHSRRDVRWQRQLCLEAVGQLAPDRSDLRAWTMACLGIPMGPGVPLSEHRAWLARALAELSRVTDPGVQVKVRAKVAMVQVLLGDPQWRELLDQIVAQTGARPREHRARWAHYAIGLEACYAGHYEVAERLLTGDPVSTATGQDPTYRASLRSAQAALDFCRGDWDGLADRAERLVDELAGFAPARVEAELVAGCLRLAHGDLTGAGALLRGLRDALETGSGLSFAGLVVTALVRGALASGDTPAAVATVRQLQAVLAEKGIWAAIVRGLPAMAEALLRDGDPAGAAELVDTATTQLRGLDTPLAPAAIQHARGLLATTSGHGLPAVRHLLDAAASYERLRCPYEAAQAREQAGVLQLVAGDPAGAASLRAAYTIYQRLGASWDLDRAAHTARRYGVSMPARHRRGRRGYGTQLSPREREVAELVSAGRTNEEIAAELFLSVSTVEKHVKAVLRKSGATTRWQIRHRLAGTGVAVPAP